VSYVPDEPVESGVVEAMTSRGAVRAQMVLSESNRTGRSKAARWSAAEPLPISLCHWSPDESSRKPVGMAGSLSGVFQLLWLEPAHSNPCRPACAAISPALPGVFWVREHITPKQGCPPPPLHSPSCPFLLHK